jgi:hypothetical protein
VRRATWALVETSLLTLDGVKRRSALEALSIGGMSKSVIDVFRKVALCAASPTWLAEIATFALAFTQHPLAYGPLVELSGERFLDGRPNTEGIRHAALWGVAELNVRRHEGSGAFFEGELTRGIRPSHLFTRASGIVDNRGDLAFTSEVWRHPLVTRAAAYGLALSQEGENAEVLATLERAPDPAVRSLARWGHNALPRLSVRNTWIKTLPTTREDHEWRGDDRWRLNGEDVEAGA